MLWDATSVSAVMRGICQPTVAPQTLPTAILSLGAISQPYTTISTGAVSLAALSSSFNFRAHGNKRAAVCTVAVSFVQPLYRGPLNGLAPVVRSAVQTISDQWTHSAAPDRCGSRTLRSAELTSSDTVFSPRPFLYSPHSQSVSDSCLTQFPYTGSSSRATRSPGRSTSGWPDILASAQPSPDRSLAC